MTGQRQRKLHTKSRNGCLQCKKGHNKCNEVRPVCGNCERRQVSCSLSEPPSNRTSPGTRSTEAIAYNLRGRSEEEVFTSLHILDLELMHNSITSTSKTFGKGNPEHEGRHAEISFTHRYVLHVGLALSALHLFSKQPSRLELFERASAHQNEALRLVRPEISNLTQDNALPVFLFSGPTSVFAMAEPNLSPSHQNNDPVNDLLSSFQLSRGIKTILVQHWTHLNTTWIASALVPDDDQNERHYDLDTVHPAYTTLKGYITSACDNDENVKQAEACHEAVETLFRYMTMLETHPELYDNPKLVQMWPIDVPQLYIDMLSKKDPVALVVVGYYAALMRLRSDTWWLNNWPRRILQRVGEILGPAYADILQWPRDRVMRSCADEVYTPTLPGT